MTILLASTRRPIKTGKADQVTVYKLSEYLSITKKKSVFLLFPENGFLILARVKKVNGDIKIEEIDKEKVSIFDKVTFILRYVWSFSPIQVTIFKLYSPAYCRLMTKHSFKFIYAHLARTLGFVPITQISGCGLQISHYLNYYRLCRELPMIKLEYWFYYLESKLMYHFERNLFSKGRFKINLISQADSKAIGIPNANPRLMHVAHGVDIPTLIDQRNKKFKMDNKIFGFLANFAPATNRVSLENLINSIWSQYKSMGGIGQLIIAGRNIPDKYLNGNLPDGIVCLGEVEVLSEFYDRVDFILNPVRACAGMQNKILTALAYKKPCILFSEGNEGLNLPNSVVKIPETSSNQAFVAMMNEIGCDDIKNAQILSGKILQEWSWDVKHEAFVKGMNF